MIRYDGIPMDEDPRLVELVLWLRTTVEDSRAAELAGKIVDLYAQVVGLRAELGRMHMRQVLPEAMDVLARYSAEPVTVCDEHALLRPCPLCPDEP